MKSLQEIQAFLAENKEVLRQRFKVKGMGIFGSFIRGDQKKGSDIDILVDFQEEADLFDLTGLGIFLEEKLNQKVDIIPRRSLKKEIKSSVLKEVISV